MKKLTQRRRSRSKTGPSSPPRVRLAAHIDLSVADPACDHCKGSGVVGHQFIDMPRKKKEKVPVICRCVTRGGGVKPDALDRIAKQIENDLAAGTFSANLAQDIKGMNQSQRTMALTQLHRDLENPDKTAQAKEAITETLRILGVGDNN